MEGDRPSGTALAVAFARAAATIDRGGPAEGLDPFARELLPAPLGGVIDLIARAGSVAPLLLRAVRAASLGVVDHCELRSLAIDAVVRDALAAGATQLAILGAGLDARALRLDEAARVRTFEIDHPATQRYKRRHTGATSRDVRFVAVDFERDSLAAKLAEAGHDSSRPTVWIWEGTTPYLAPEATLATLRVLGARSAPGSTLAATYVTPEMIDLPGVLKPIAHAAFGIIGEPLRGILTSARFGSMLDESGFRRVDDTGVAEWSARFGGGRPTRTRLAERLVVAHAA